MERLIAPIEIKAAKSDGKFTGYAAVFGNIDLGYDVIEPGAFKSAKTTKDGMLRIAIGHNLNMLAGKATFEQDDRGLRVEGQLSLGVSYVRDQYELMKDGVLDGLSVGFNIMRDGAEYVERSGKHVRVIKAAELWEFSIVPFGMNPEALVDSVKAASIRDFEAQLRGLGYSQAEAKALASGGFKSLDHRDGGRDSETLADALQTLKHNLTF
ncbi:HK97 family phage prohead protease [Noviherbaspirillum malthae]|uniref:HK97 family phage prohead protease n=1 Tax=Noviherbaspirillum malthae TaxID=1260987 RepID=UPI00188DCFFE|nr:HK97 family phage prohead protease [Noviherbaspirillum malthae]